MTVRCKEQTHHRLTDDKQFRLVILSPSADFDSKIECRLWHATLGTCRPYEALSYVWGTPKFTSQIFLGGNPFLITPSLDCALRHLRLATDERTLWVDAICINQADLTERREQVGHMRQIYSNCSSDILWLGPENEDYLRVMEIIHKVQGLERERIETLGWKFEYYYRPELLESGEAEEDDDAYRQEWGVTGRDKMAVFALLRDNPVWSRVWIVQEIACAPKVVLHCGSTTLDWCLVESILDGMETYNDSFHGAFSHSHHWMWKHLFSIAKMVANQRVMMKRMSDRNESRLFDVLARFKYTQSTDARDKIYGLLGLVSDSLGAEADYTRGVVKTYTDVAIAITNSTANLDLICQCPWKLPSDARTGCLEHLACWVPDFSSMEDGEFLFAQRGIYAAGKPTCRVPCLLEGANTLLLEGVILDRLKAPYDDEMQMPDTHGWSDSTAFSKSLRDWGCRIMSWSALHYPDETKARYPTDEDRFQALLRTLAGDCKGHPTERLTPEDISHDQSTLLNADSGDVTRMRSFKMLQKFTLQRKLWMTTKGLFVLAPRDAKEGDVVAILDGAKVPMILRLREVSGGKTLYQPVGGVYVHGFMDGEVLKRKHEFEEVVVRLI